MLIEPDWPQRPTGVRALYSTRHGGVSLPPYDSFNLAQHVGDDPQAVAANRQQLRDSLPGVRQIQWLNQVHGSTIVEPGVGQSPDADGCVSRKRGVACAIMTADCLPVLLCDREATVVAAVHAGWRGLAGGVLEGAVAALGCAPASVTVWLGPAIGPEAFEIGPEVKDALTEGSDAATACLTQGESDRWHADLYALARLRLQSAGVTDIAGGGECTLSAPDTYFSHRRENPTGRMAFLIYLI